MSTNPVLWAWRGFRSWRRSRPFWGGLLVLLAGAEILSIPLAPMPILIHAGIGAMSGLIIGAVLMLAGLMLWFTPDQRTFLGIISIILGLASWPFTNLGGFVLGMLLALVGGALGFAWMPLTPKAAPPVAPTVPDTDLDDLFAGPPAEQPDPQATEVLPVVTEPAAAEQVAETPVAEAPVAEAPAEPEPAPGVRPNRYRRPNATPPAESVSANHQVRNSTLAVTGALMLGLIVTAVASPTAGAFAAPPGAVPCAPGQQAPVDHNAPAAQPPAKPVPAQPPVPGQPTPPKPSPGTTVAPTKSPVVSPSPAKPAPAVSPSPTYTPPWWWPFPAPAQQAARQAVPAAPKASPSASPLCHRALAAAGGQPMVALGHSDMVVSTLIMDGANYAGVVELPTANGPIRVLKFTMDNASNVPFEMTSPDGPHKLHQTSTRLVVNGNVEFYASRFRGSLWPLDLPIPIPVDFSPDSPPPLTLPHMKFTDARIDLVYLHCGTLTADNLKVQEIA